MPAYYNAVSKGVSTIMASYSSWNGLRMHANRELITGFLKNKLKFRVMSPTFWVILCNIEGNASIIVVTNLCFCNVFQGFVISDWQGIDRITTPPHQNYTYSVEISINAGIDMVG